MRMKMLLFLDLFGAAIQHSCSLVSGADEKCRIEYDRSYAEGQWTFCETLNLKWIRQISEKMRVGVSTLSGKER